jgi:two-component system CheB/CheR fusion protein
MVVGIGASAGGLAALKTFFAHLPERSGLAFVVVVHLSPEHESHLADLLQSHARMPVEQVTETVPLKPDHVYVIPPGCNLSAIDTHLRTSELEEQRSERAPIDYFFRTLSLTHDGYSVGVILTGTGSDGSLGLKHIKERGGLALVQSPEEAEYDGMPRSAIATGLVDLVLPIAEIPKAILRYANAEPQVTVPADGEDLNGNERRLLRSVIGLILARTGRDFRRYKRPTIMRRIEHRMQLRQVRALDVYLDLLRDDISEVRALADDFLIIVTSFFRDAETFEKLERDVIPMLFDERSPDETIRLWTVGCATGEEAYSLAILLQEAIARHQSRGERPPALQVFASDLHDESLEKAREGFFPDHIEANVSAERLERFFHKEEGGYRIRQDVRELVVFAPHNLLSDPPFSKLDLVTCRNLLIYLERDVQKEIVHLFHFALRTDGFLVLGKSETIEGSGPFRVVSKSHGLFQKRSTPVAERRLPVFPLSRGGDSGAGTARRRREGPSSVGALHHQMVERYAPPSILVSPDDRIIHSSEHAWRYLRHPGGASTDEACKLVREEFQLELRTALLSARERRQATRTLELTRFCGRLGVWSSSVCLIVHFVLHGRLIIEG